MKGKKRFHVESNNFGHQRSAFARKGNAVNDFLLDFSGFGSVEDLFFPLADWAKFGITQRFLPGFGRRSRDCLGFLYAGGVTAISRWLSAATPPEKNAQNERPRSGSQRRKGTKTLRPRP